MKFASRSLFTASEAPLAGFERVRGLLKGFVIVVATCGVYALGCADEGRATTIAARESVSQMVYRYRIRHGGRCPRDLTVVAREASRSSLPPDGWGTAFTLQCPSVRSERELRDFDLVSAGPDRVPGGLDALD